jgi:hypothetical protein
MEAERARKKDVHPKVGEDCVSEGDTARKKRLVLPRTHAYMHTFKGGKSDFISS